MNALLERPALNGEEIARKAMMTPAQRTVDKMQAVMEKMPQVECPLDHEFVGLFYVRTIRVPAGTLVVSKIFKADFPFFISKGRVSVWVEGVGVVRREAPYWGFTKAGQRRIIMHHTDVVWSTIHPNPNGLRDIDALECEVIYDPKKDITVEISAEVMRELKEENL